MHFGFLFSQSAYDQAFHSGVNIIRGENGSGKSTIADFIFYALGGEFDSWKATAKLCDEVQAEVVTKGGVITIRRAIDTRTTTPDACTIRIDQVSFEFRKVRRPRPKGGANRAFDSPLSETLLEVAKRRIADNKRMYGDNCPWLFPTFDRAGMITHTKEPKEKGLPSAHRLRDTYATAGHEEHIGDFDLKILMNHMIPEDADVTHGYIRPSWEYIAALQDRICGFLRRKIGNSS